MQTLSSHELIAAVRDAWSTGRAIIPVMGAGTSVDAGIPPIAELIRYLGAVYATITQGLYLPQSPLHNPDPLVMVLSSATKLGDVIFSRITAGQIALRCNTPSIALAPTKRVVGNTHK